MSSPFTMIEDTLFESAEWRRLSHIDARILIDILRVVKSANRIGVFDGGDVRPVFFGPRDCSFDVSRNAFYGALNHLKSAGFITFDSNPGRRASVTWIWSNLLTTRTGSPENLLTTRTGCETCSSREQVAESTCSSREQVEIEPVHPVNRTCSSREHHTNTIQDIENTSAPYLVFPIQGNSTWTLPEALGDQYRSTYGGNGVDVNVELRKAQSWCESNPTKRKTARGMPRFLNAWLNRASNNGGAPTFKGMPIPDWMTPPRDPTPEEAIKMLEGCDV